MLDHPVQITDLPSFPSPYPSEQNSASKNQLLTPLTLKQSDLYENLPLKFQELVPKTHLRLTILAELFDKFERGEKPSDGFERAYWWIFKGLNGHKEYS